MSAREPLYHIVGINPVSFSKEENMIVDAVFFARLCELLKKKFKDHYKNYFRVMKFNEDVENSIMETHLVRCVINDILSTEEYTLTGIAYYTETPEDVIDDVAAGRNISPSAVLFRRLIDLHQSVRRDLYQELMKKIASEYLVTAC